MIEQVDMTALVHLIAGRKPHSPRTFSPESVRRKENAATIADITDEHVSGPIREWIDALTLMVEAATTALESVEEASGELRDAESPDDREDAYAALDQAFNELAEALDEMGVER